MNELDKLIRDLAVRSTGEENAVRYECFGKRHCLESDSFQEVPLGDWLFNCATDEEASVLLMPFVSGSLDVGPGLHCELTRLLDVVPCDGRDGLFTACWCCEDVLAAILQVFCEKGSHMIQPNCNSVEELLDAQQHPERHRNLIVRVCGFSARFIHLSKHWQDEVIERHRLK